MMKMFDDQFVALGIVIAAVSESRSRSITLPSHRKCSHSWALFSCTGELTPAETLLFLFQTSSADLSAEPGRHAADGMLRILGEAHVS